jgi:hypothetical protein
MSWRDLLFAHWPVPAGALRERLPRGLELDLFDGTAWLGIVPFRMVGTRLRGLPPVPGLSTFPELNVRTYVRRDGKPGVWFFSLDAANRPAVRAARAAFGLPYFDARMEMRRDRGAIVYASDRVHAGVPAARFRARYAPAGDVFHATPGSLEAWLTDRYCLYAKRTEGPLSRVEIDHAPWPLRAATARFELLEMTRLAGVALPPRDPHLLFVDRIDVVAWWRDRLD